MAVTVRRAALLAVGGCLVIATAYLPPSPDPPARDPLGRSRSRAQPFREPLWQARRAVSRAEMVLRLLEQRDSAITSGRNASVPLVQVSGAWRSRADAVRQVADSALRRVAAWPANPRKAVTVVLVGHGPPFHRSFWEAARSPARTMYFVPADTLEPCVTVTTVGLARSDTTWASLLETHLRFGADGILGPCAIAAELGSPGPGIARWLASGGAVFARTSGVARRSEEGEPWAWDADVYEPVWGWGWRTGDLPWVIEALAGGTVAYWSYDQFGPEDFALENCRRGRRSSCAILLKDPSGFGFRTPSQAVYDLAVVSLGKASGPEHRAYWLLGDLRREFGDATFARFWRASEDAETAFAAAFGVPAGEWMYRWVRAHIGPPSYEPTLGVADALLSLGAGVLLLGIGAALSNRRRIETG